VANAIKGRHETQHHDTQHNDILQNDTQHKGLRCDTQHNNAAIMLSVTVLKVIMLSVVAPIKGTGSAKV
jgi:hypothetical protein